MSETIVFGFLFVKCRVLCNFAQTNTKIATVTFLSGRDVTKVQLDLLSLDQMSTYL